MIIVEYKVVDLVMMKGGIIFFMLMVCCGLLDYFDLCFNCYSKLYEVVVFVQVIEVGVDEVFMFDVNGFVLICNVMNFFVVCGGEVWMSIGNYCMQGIMWKKFLFCCCENGILSYEKDFLLVDVYLVDEVFVIGMFGGVMLVKSVDGWVIGDGEEGLMILWLCEFYMVLIEWVVIQEFVVKFLYG